MKKFTLVLILLSQIIYFAKGKGNFEEEVLALTLQKGDKLETIESTRTLKINDQPLAAISFPEEKVSLLNDNIKLTPLMQYVLNNQVQNVEKLIEEEGNVNQSIENDISPLLLAIFIRNPKIINLLLKNGANLSIELIEYGKKFADKTTLEILENFQKSVIKNALNPSLIPDLQNICLDYLNLTKNKEKQS